MSRSHLRLATSLAPLAAASLLFVTTSALAQTETKAAAEPEPAKPAVQADAAKPAVQAQPSEPSALAEPTPRAPAQHFGEAGQFALSLNEEFSVNVTDLIGANQLQASYFIAPHVSLGLMIGAQWSSSSILSSGSSSEVVFRVGPRVGYELAVSDYVSIWPQIGIDYRRVDETPTGNGSSGVSADSSTLQAIAFTALVPVLIHPTKGFFVGAGPTFYTEVQDSSSTGGNSTDNNKVTAIGLMATIGGAI